MMTALFHTVCEGMRSLFRLRGNAPDTTPQRGISLNAYLGRWYEQARYECFFERGLDHVCADYAKDEHGGILITNSGTTARGRHKEVHGRATTPQSGVLAVSFVPPYTWFRSPYHILYVDESYRMALVSGEGSGYLWLLTRARKADDMTMRCLLDEAQKRGFDISALRLTLQRTEDEVINVQNRKSAPKERKGAGW